MFYEIALVSSSQSGAGIFTYVFPEGIQDVFLDYVMMDFLADGTVANRIPQLRLLSRTGLERAVIPSTVNTVANATLAITWSPHLGAAVQSPNGLVVAVPAPLHVQPFDTIEVAVNGGQAGDLVNFLSLGYFASPVNEAILPK